MRGTIRVFVPSVALIFSIVVAAGIANGYAGQTTRVSVNSAGAAANSTVASGVLSADGRYVVFASAASNLGSGMHVYRHDRMAPYATVQVDITPTGELSTGPSFQPTVSKDGRYVAFTSQAADLVTTDTHLVQQVFVRDMNTQTNSTRLVSANAADVAGDRLSGLSGLAGAHEISDDGRYVVFLSTATNLMGDAVNAFQQVYVKDVTERTVVRASVTNGTPAELANGFTTTPVISGNGHVVAFGASAPNLGATSSQVYTRNLVSGVTTLETLAAGALASTVPALSFDGRYLAFVTSAQLDRADADINGDVYLRDRDPSVNTTVLVSQSLNGFSGVPTSSPSISSDDLLINDGRWIAYQSLDDMLVTGDVGGLIDVFLWDRVTNTTTLVSRNDAGEQASGTLRTTGSTNASVSGDGNLVLFSSNAGNLFDPPVTAVAHLYVRNLVSNQAPVLRPFDRDFPLSEGQAMNLTWDFSDPDSSRWNATVNYGDRSGVQPLVLNRDKTFVLEHLWAPGPYDVTVEVTDDAGATGTLVIHVVVSNVAPTVGLLATMDLAFTRTLDTFGTFTDPGSRGETYTAFVNYGDGTPTEPLRIGPYDASPLVGGSFTLHHTYAAAGRYTVIVAVTDSNGDSTRANMLVKVGGYSYEWFDPLGDTFVVGRNVPVKFTVRGPSGEFVLDRTVVVDVVDASGNLMGGPYAFGDQPSRSVTWSGDSYHVNVDTKDLAPGMYWLRVSFSSPTLTGSFTLATNGTADATTGATTKSRLR
jgi:Tol biopolymer transport system component